MEYIKRINVNNLENSNKYNFTFLDDFKKKLDIKFYYNICNKISVRDINNIYTIIYIKWTRIINTNKNLKLINIINPKKKYIHIKKLIFFFIIL